MLRATDTIWKTDTGRQRRDNEDNAYVRAPLFVVADGMGGAQAGEVASKLAVEEFHRELPQDGTPEERLATRVQSANRVIYDVSRSEHEHAGMGTTLTAVYVDDVDLAVAHVGDSRAYIFRDGVLTRLTQDHSLVEELVRRGKLTEEQAAEHPQRSIITRALGIELDVEVDTWTYPARAGDVVLMCSDGLTSMIGEDQIAEVLATESDLDRAGERLIAEANEAGGRDNITVVLFRLEDVGSEARVDEPTVVGLQPPPPPTTGSETEGARADAAQDGPVARSSSSAILTPPVPRPAQPSQPRASVPLARRQGRPDRTGPGPRHRGPRRFARPLAALIAVVVVLFLVGGGGYIASRELFFVGTNSQGIVTIYRGLPYDLPLGVHMYESFYVSGLPAAAVPADRRAALFNHDLRSQAAAISLVHAAELDQLSK
jgi:serine/threonine protein phosphatase PrpC